MENEVYPNFLQGFILTICLVVILVVSYVLASIPIHLNISVPHFYTSLVFAISPFLIVPVIIYALRRSKIKLFEDTHFPKLIICGILVLLAVSLRILAIPLINPLEYIHYFLNGKLEFFKFKAIEPNTDFIITFINGVILAPVFEEVFFRGILLRQFLKKYSPRKAILLSALLFALAHLKIMDAINLFASGLLFGYVFFKTNSIVASILIHSFSNLIHYVTKIYVIPMNDSSLGSFVFFMSVSILIIYLYVKYIDNIQNKHADT